ncbi:MAG: NADH-quinone oxidoreductase subunit C [candidate division Zixibacteria bacterium]|nr:NADH-quinone oxidoreductase subunit C [candidate division Zixibacteria bacterium]
MENLTLTRLKEKFPELILETVEFRGELTVVVKKEDIVPVCNFLRDDPELSFNFLSDLCGVDYMGRKPRFDVVYHLYSLDKKHRVRLKVKVEEGENVPTVTSVWSNANWFEREVFDMFGVKFDNHPDLRRILMPEDWEGHPLRKDFPLTKEEVTFTHNKNHPPRIME